MLAASLNAFFCASPIYGSAEDFTFLLDVTVSRKVTPAAKQQIGETRKKCNSDDRRLRRRLERSCTKAKFSFARQKRTRKAPATFEAREARIKGYSPLIIPKELSKRKKASRFA